jgi:hypothetical protein
MEQSTFQLLQWKAARVAGLGALASGGRSGPGADRDERLSNGVEAFVAGGWRAGHHIRNRQALEACYPTGMRRDHARASHDACPPLDMETIRQLLEAGVMLQGPGDEGADHHESKAVDLTAEGRNRATPLTASCE